MSFQSIIHGGVATGGSKTTIVDALLDLPADAVKDKYAKVWLGGKTLFRKITTNTANTITFLTLGDAAGASCTVKAASAASDTLAVAIAATEGSAGNGLKINLTTAATDALAVTKNDTTGVITIALAKTTASKNAAATVQAALRALGTVANVSVSAATCTAGGNWNTAAIATGETGAKAFTGGVYEIDVAAGSPYEILSI